MMQNLIEPKIILFLIHASTMHQEFLQSLTNQQNCIGDRYFAVFQLKNIGTDDAIKALIEAYPSCGDSILLKHELLYALGQLPSDKYPLVRGFLLTKMSDESENNLSRHEAAEALANYFDDSILEHYEKYQHSDCKELKYTCQIALEKLKQKETRDQYGLDYNRTMEPAAPLTQAQFQAFLSESDLQQVFAQKSYLGLLCQQLSLFQKYRIMYYMRNKKTKDCIEALCQLLGLQYYATQTSLLKHEICFILGQIGYDQYEQLVRQCVQNEQEEDIVRHQALAAVASQSKDPQYLKRFLDAKYPLLIRESAEVAIHSIKYWNE